MANWVLSASGQVPATDPATPAIGTEVELYEALQAILGDPRYGTGASSFSGSHVSGSLHQPDA